MECCDRLEDCNIYVPIVVTWVLLVKLALGKYTRPKIKQNKCPVCGESLSESEFATHLENNHKGG